MNEHSYESENNIEEANTNTVEVSAPYHHEVPLRSTSLDESAGEFKPRTTGWYYHRQRPMLDDKPHVQAFYTNIRSNFRLPSEESLDVYIPSYPGSPRSLSVKSSSSFESKTYQSAVKLLQEDNDLFIAAETGNDKMLEILIRKGDIDIQQTDHLGRNALHMAVTTGNQRAIHLLLEAGIDVKIKDNIGMTPLLLSLMRRPSAYNVRLLFDHGAVIMPRVSPMDTGLFLQFVMMCTPTTEEEEILHLLVQHGSKVNDPEAPGQRQALHFAAMSNNCNLIRILLELGANPYMKNHRNETPWEVAKHFNCKEAAAFLAEIEHTTIYGSESRVVMNNS